MAKAHFKIFPRYTTSLIYVTRLEEIEMFEHESDYQHLNDNAKAYLIAEQNKRGGWDIFSKLQGSYENEEHTSECLVFEDLNFEQMIVQLAYGESIYLDSAPFNDLDRETFFPQNAHLVPEPEELDLLKRYINKNKAPKNHICRLMYEIGKDKAEHKSMCKKLDTQITKQELAALKPSIPGVHGQKLFLN